MRLDLLLITRLLFTNFIKNGGFYYGCCIIPGISLIDEDLTVLAEFNTLFRCESNSLIKAFVSFSILPGGDKVAAFAIDNEI